MTRTSALGAIGFVAVAFAATTSAQQPATGKTSPRGAAVEIELRHNTPNEQATADQLRRLLTKFDVSPWLFTGRVLIDEQAIPHSHPVLTLHTRHLAQDSELL